eukprot:NODE_4918_length_1095_cov_23.206790_g4370_i0.p1 GENE.NODE_4918_length_1095_cov_23.206790_g4370_i0~~NODE_4918_length_1095_cov_23.206790_g4370_i0.p1  ORF type:complete len:294 (-),score=56.90 NODE_4918_length_1095_cov_23.206790_g4370_i0:142-1023(-)
MDGKTKKRKERHDHIHNKYMEKLERRKKRKKLEKELGENAPPKQVPKTLETLRTPDETFVQEGDEEIQKDEEEDEWANYYKEEVTPKLMITTCQNPNKATKKFVRELRSVWPTAKFYPRKNKRIKFLTKLAIKKNYTDLMIITEQHKEPYNMIISHLPHGPTAFFRISGVILRKDLEEPAAPTTHVPELNLKNFTTRLGRRVSRMLRSMFPIAPNLKGRSIATFHNQRDFVFFRLHRYIFDSLEAVRIQEIGPRFTLRLKNLLNGLFDTKNGEYEWAYHKKEMGGKDRRMFNL